MEQARRLIETDVESSLSALAMRILCERKAIVGGVMSCKRACEVNWNDAGVRGLRRTRVDTTWRRRLSSLCLKKRVGLKTHFVNIVPAVYLVLSYLSPANCATWQPNSQNP